MTALQSDPKAILQGASIYQRYCAACHRRDLKGSVGPNLKDGEWLHGSAPSQILSSIQNGFDVSGMPSFANVLSPSQQASLLAFILSKREGFEDLHFTLYQQDSRDDLSFTQKDVIKSGPIKNNYMDFSSSEVADYAFVFDGTFYTSKDEKTFFYAEPTANFNLTLEINSQKIKPETWGHVHRWPLLKGKQRLTFTYISANSKDYLRDIPIYVTNQDGSIKLFPVSTKARIVSKISQFELKATDGYVVAQKKIVKLPPYSIAVGAPQKVNYAFNTKSCAVNGLWSGDLLDLGPNIGGRGKDASIPMGDWLYHFPSQLSIEIKGEGDCQFEKYVTGGAAPTFWFTVDGVKLRMTSDITASNQVIFQYTVLDNPDKLEVLSVNLPDLDNLNISSTPSMDIGESLEVNIQQHEVFSIKMQWVNAQ
jgi:hypothetical protein